MGKTIVVLGAGTGGVVCANVLKKTLPPGHKIILVDRLNKHYFLASLPLVVIGKRRVEQISRPLRQLHRESVQFLQTDVMSVKPDNKTILTTDGLLPYDYLIVALGAKRTTAAIAGQAEYAHNPYDPAQASRLNKILAKFHHGRLVIFIASLPFTGAIAPYELAFLLRAYFHQRGLDERVQITFITPEKFPMEQGGPITSHQYLQLFEKRRIKVVTRATVKEVEKNALLLTDGRRIPADLVIGIPAHFGPGLFTDRVLADKEGWLKVNGQTLAMDLEDVYAIGDGVGCPRLPKVGFFAHYEGEVVARNIALQIAGKRPRFRFTADAIGASMLTETHRGSFISLDSYLVPPKLTISSPNLLAALTKSLFEKYWLNFWL